MGSVLNPLMRSSKLRTVRGVARTQKATPFGHADGYCGVDGVLVLWYTGGETLGVESLASICKMWVIIHQGGVLWTLNLTKSSGC